MRKVCLVTGTPGVGKTTLCSALARELPTRYQHISFGGLILKCLNEDGFGGTEADLRRRVSQLVTAQVISRATDLLVQETNADGNENLWLLLDSHAVSQDRFGFIATPDGPSYFQRLRYSAIINLFADPTEVLKRSNPDETGRQARTADDVATHANLQNAVTVLYSAFSACPAFFVDANARAGCLTEVVDRLLCPQEH